MAKKSQDGSKPVRRAKSEGRAKPIRRGGYSGPKGYVFELSGGALCLELVNTVDNRPTESRDLLRDYSDLLAWAAQTGCCDAPTVAVLEEQAKARPRAAASALVKVRAVRELLFSVIAAIADSRDVSGADLDRFNAELRAQLPRLGLNPERGSGFAWRWRAAAIPALDFVLGPVLWSAAELLVSADLARVRRCAADNCDWLFLDRSKNASRRWCDMTVCGNRSKARRFYRRARKAAGAGANGSTE